ncbi:hypothetical protein [Janthinobacterium fluminis]|uniref:Uncharacterized protein n=1 Tax=Janthinobacterium fluminis TaxID=2987524 RepID=A0ABT5K7K9_9BURK|nr:hypothetical protein [Janthinobacterium fluminis]MDC8760635.1 hypothetical protein [Janthinobacterium fluminis]
MRPLAQHEIDLVSGANETNTYTLPAGASVTLQLEANNSTTIRFTFDGGRTFSWNSGVWMACAVIGAGFGLAVTSFTLNPMIGSLTSTLVSFGCTAMVNSQPTGNDPADGD